MTPGRQGAQPGQQQRRQEEILIPPVLSGFKSHCWEGFCDPVSVLVTEVDAKKKEKKIELGQSKTPGIYVGNKQVHHNINNYCLWITCASQVVLVVKNLPANAGDVRDAGLVPGSGRSAEGRHGNPVQYFCLENPGGSLVGYSPWGHGVRHD